MKWSIQILNQLISRLKGENFAFDANVSFIDLLDIIFSKLISLFRGFLVFKHVKKRVFIDAKCVVKCRRKIKFGTNLMIGRCSYINALSKNGIVMGRNVSIGKNTTIECSGSFKLLGEGLVVGNFVGLGSHGFFGCAGGIKIGDNTILGNYVSMHSENHNFSNINILIRQQGVSHKGISIGSDCWIGAKVTILDGAEIGNGCVFAAGAVVPAGKYEDNCVYAGVPAKLIKKRY